MDDDPVGMAKVLRVFASLRRGSKDSKKKTGKCRLRSRSAPLADGSATSGLEDAFVASASLEETFVASLEHEEFMEYVINHEVMDEHIINEHKDEAKDEHNEVEHENSKRNEHLNEYPGTNEHAGEISQLEHYNEREITDGERTLIENGNVKENLIILNEYSLV